jgi:hypothetical protein
MAFTERELADVHRLAGGFVASGRPPEHIRAELDLGYRVIGQSFEIFEIRPAWRRPERILEIPFARATYVRSRVVWRLYWKRADLKWHIYGPLEETVFLPKVLEEIGSDPYHCFRG